jgi:pyrroline-5-carboxylate reductase
MRTVLDDIKCISSGKLFVSIAMGITLNEIENNLANDSRVIRVMPNTPALVQAGSSVYVKGKSATTNDAELIVNLLKSVGICEEVTEYMMDAVTALSGSGPAYVSLRDFPHIFTDFLIRFVLTDICVDRSFSRWRGYF